jgi:iron-sulfur cluster repair protein YtfE (RIC family)
MLTNISSENHSGGRSSSPQELLEGCHSRIRHFMQLSRTLAGNPNAQPAEIAEAAGAIYRYFHQSLALHEADENHTLVPRLRQAQHVPAAVREAAETMLEQHWIIDELVAEMLHFCDVIHRNPDLLPTLVQFDHVTSALDQIFEAHMRMEETVIFPALAEFPASELEAMRREMQERRQTQDQIHTKQ